jgi:hypothetical protein
MDELEAQRGAIDDVMLRSRMLDTAEELFDEAISLQVRRGNAETAFAVTEHARGRSLLDAVEGSPQPLSSSSAVAGRLEPGTLLLEYAVLPEQLVIFAISNDGMKMHIVKVKREELASHKDLAPLLLEPVRDDVAAAKSLIVVPEKSLQRVAFAGLRWNGAHLVQSHAISIAPSASRLAASRPVTKPKVASILLVGNPTADEEQNLEQLPAVEREINATRAFYGPARVLLDEEATRARFAEEAPKHDVIHFAGHGTSDDGSLTAALLFARGDGRHRRPPPDPRAAGRPLRLRHLARTRGRRGRHAQPRPLLPRRRRLRRRRHPHQRRRRPSRRAAHVLPPPHERRRHTCRGLTRRAAGSHRPRRQRSRPAAMGAIRGVHGHAVINGPKNAKAPDLSGAQGVADGAVERI